MFDERNGPGFSERGLAVVGASERAVDFGEAGRCDQLRYVVFGDPGGGHHRHPGACRGPDQPGEQRDALDLRGWSVVGG